MSQRPESSKGPASAGPFRVVGRRGAAVVLACGLLLSGCKTGKAPPDEGAAAAELPKRLGAQPAVIDPASTTTTVGPDGTVGGGGPGGGPGGGGNGSTATSAPGGGGTTNTTRPVPPFRSLASAPDPTGDAGLEAPGYDDVVSLRIEDNGESARLTVEFAAAVPPKLADGEIMGVGIDLYRGEARESAYQVFADGSNEGWLAYLQVGEEFVKYPGTFELGGTRLVFTVPWTSIGGRSAGQLAMFADWSQARTLIAAAGQDKAPNQGTRLSFGP